MNTDVVPLSEIVRTFKPHERSQGSGRREPVYTSVDEQKKEVVDHKVVRAYRSCDHFVQKLYFE